VQDPSRAGDRSLRRPVYGARSGRRKEIAHAAFGHPLEGQHIGSGAGAASCVTPNHSLWHVAGALGLLKLDTMIGVGTMIRPLEAIKPAKVA